MLSLIEVTCPHCGAHGQIMLPPVGTIIVGPCPECQGLVVVFCGHVLALNKETMLNGSVQEKREHLMTVLTQFLRDRIAQMISDETDAPESESEPSEEDTSPVETSSETASEPEPRRARAKVAVPISKEESDSFTNVDLKLLDNKDYFKAIFG